MNNTETPSLWQLETWRWKMDGKWIKIETHQKQTHKPVFGSFFTSFLALFFISIFWKMKSKMRTMNMLNLCQHPQHQYQPWMSIKTTIFGKSFQRGWCQDSLHQWSLDHWALRTHTESHAHTQSLMLTHKIFIRSNIVMCKGWSTVQGSGVGARRVRIEKDPWNSCQIPDPYSHPPANDTLELRNWLHQIWAQPFITKTTWKS